jgi:hypothetical protein
MLTRLPSVSRTRRRARSPEFPWARQGPFHRCFDVVHCDDDGWILGRPVFLLWIEAAIDRARRLRTAALVRLGSLHQYVVTHLRPKLLRLPAKGALIEIPHPSPSHARGGMAGPLFDADRQRVLNTDAMASGVVIAGPPAAGRPRAAASGRATSRRPSAR